MVENQAYLFLVFSLTGIMIGCLFDIFRVSRKLFKTPNFITYIEDLLFWILTGILILYTAWYFNDGELRFFMILGLTIGIIIYILTISNIFVKISFNILNKLKNIIIHLLKLISNIFKPFVSIFSKIFDNLIKILNKNVKKVEKIINFQNKKGRIEKNEE